MMIPQLLFVTGGGDSQAIVTRIQKSKHDAHFTEIFLSGIHVDQPILEALFDILEHGKWEGIHMGQCTGMVHNLIEHSCSRVQKLSLLCDFCRMEPSWCQSLSRGLQDQSCRLTKLMLRVQLSHDLAIALYEGLSVHHSSLEELVLPISDSSLKSIVLLSTALRQCRSLKKLRLNRHDLVWTMDAFQIVTLMKALEGHESLQDLSIQGSSCNEAGIQVISECVVKGLEKLDLSNHRFGGDRLCGMEHLTASLKNNNNRLKFLSLSGHRLTETDISGLAASLEHCQLEELCLTNCHLSDQSIVIFAKMLPKMKHLKYLWLHDNPFGQVGASALLASLERNCELEHLILPRGRGSVMDGLQRQIEFYLVLNRAGRRLLRATNNRPVPLALWPKVLDRAGKARRDYYFAASKGIHVDAIFHLLQGPVLFGR
jgi:hypothetical protein